MKKLMTVLAAVMTAAVSFAAETLGVWVFNGTPGQTCSGMIPNLVQNESGIAMEVGKMTDSSPNAVYQSDLPLQSSSALALYDSRKQGVRYGTVTSSVHLESSGNLQNTVNSPYIRAKGFGAALKGKDYTVEVIYRGTNYYNRGTHGPANRFVMGVGGDNVTTGGMGLEWHLSEYNQGRIYGMTPSSEMPDWQKLEGCKTVAWRAFEYKWYCMVFKYSAADRKLTVSRANNHEDDSSANITWTEDEVPVMTDDAFFQIMGYCGLMTAAFTRADVAAIRISEGLVESGDYLSLGQDYTTDPLLGYWRCEGTLGSAFPNEINVRPAAAFADLDAGQLRCHGGTAANYAAANKLWVCAGDQRVANGSSVANTSSGLQLLVDSLYPMINARAFTVEAFIRVDAAPTKQAVIFGQGNSFDHHAQAWTLFLPANSLTPAVKYNDTNEAGEKLDGITSMDSSTSLVAGRWHHLAVTYDGAHSLVLYLDYKAVATKTFASSRYLQRTDNGVLFAPGYYQTNVGAERVLGAFDEFRVTGKALQPAEFLRQRNCLGFMLVVE